MSTDCDTYLNIILLIIFFGAIALYIWMNYNYKNENMTVTEPASNEPKYIVARVHHNYTEEDSDTFYAFPYTERTYKILKNMHNKTLAFYSNLIPADSPGITTKFYTGIFPVKYDDYTVYCDHDKLNDFDELSIAYELQYGMKYKMHFVNDCIGNNNDFYIRVSN